MLRGSIQGHLAPGSNQGDLARPGLSLFILLPSYQVILKQASTSWNLYYWQGAGCERFSQGAPEASFGMVDVSKVSRSLDSSALQLKPVIVIGATRFQAKCLDYPKFVLSALLLIFSTVCTTYAIIEKKTRLAHFPQTQVRSLPCLVSGLVETWLMLPWRVKITQPHCHVSLVHYQSKPMELKT